MLSNILFISTLFSSIIILVSAIYYYPLDENMTYLYFLIGLCILTSLLNHGTKKGKKKDFFRLIDRIVIRIFCLYLIILSKKTIGSEIILFKKYYTSSRYFIYYGTMIAGILYCLTKGLVYKNKNYPINILKIPHALAHITGSLVLLFIFMEYTSF